MNKRYTQFLFILLLMCSVSFVNAQIYGGANFNYTQALKTFNQNLVKNPMGISFNAFTSPFKNKKLQVGIEFGVAMYANDAFSVEIDEGELAGETFKIEEEDCFLSYTLNARYYLSNDKLINPYVEGRVGGMSFFSSQLTEEKYQDYFEDNTTFHGTSFISGFGIGTVVRLGQTVALDMSVLAINGTKADYRSIEPEEDADLRRSLDYGQKESNINNLNFKLGILFGF